MVGGCSYCSAGFCRSQRQVDASEFQVIFSEFPNFLTGIADIIESWSSGGFVYDGDSSIDVGEVAISKCPEKARFCDDGILFGITCPLYSGVIGAGDDSVRYFHEGAI